MSSRSKKRRRRKERSSRDEAPPEVPGPPDPIPGERKRTRAYTLVALAITAFCYLPAVSNGFVNWDDEPNITENPNLEQVSWGSLGDIFHVERGAVVGNYNPLPIATFALEKAIVGELDPTVIHATNVALHVLTVFFVARLLVSLGIGARGVFVGALLFGIHPMRVESVAWATERKDVLFAVFFFAALCTYTTWTRSAGSNRAGRSRLYALTLVLAILSLFSKVQAVTLPLSMLAIDYLERRPLGFARIWEKAPFWVLSLVFGLINVYTLRQQGSIGEVSTSFDLLDRLFIGSYSFCVYLQKLVVPYPMSPLYAYPESLPALAYVSPLGCLAVAAAAFGAWRRDLRMVVFGIAFFFFNIVFLLQILAAGQGFLADRFTYVAYFGPFALAAWLYERAESDRGSLSRAVAAAAFVAAAVLTVRQIGVWENGETLWTHAIAVEGRGNAVSYGNRGRFRRGEGDFEGALSDYTDALAIDPQNGGLWNSRGRTYFEMAQSGRFGDRRVELVEAAVEDYTTGLGLETEDMEKRAELYLNRGAAKAALGRLEAALEDFDLGLELDPESLSGYLNRSLALLGLERFEEAVEDQTTYLRAKPGDAGIWYERGMARRILGRNEEAIGDLDRALQLAPGNGLAHLERARARAQSGDLDAARQDYARAGDLGAPMIEFDQRLLQGRN